MIGRGSIAQVQYTGEENAPEIKKLLEAVVCPLPYTELIITDAMQVADEDSYDRWETLIEKATGIEGGVNRNSSPAAIDLVRAIYDCFLAKFPLYFAYWKKYADLEFGIGGTDTAEMVRPPLDSLATVLTLLLQVYERGVCAISNSVHLWTDYCGFKMDTCHQPETIRE